MLHVDEECRRVVGNNAVHGLLCLARLVVEYVIAWDAVDARSIRMVDEALARVLLDVSMGVPAVLVQEALELAMAFTALSAAEGSSSATRHARNIASDVVRSAGRGSPSGIGREQLESTCARLLLTCEIGASDAGLERTRAILSTRSDAIAGEAVRWFAVDESLNVDTGLTDSLLDLAQDAYRDHVVRIDALDAIVRRAERGAAVRPPSTARIRGLEMLVRTTKNTLLREAALPVLAWAVGLEYSSAATEARSNGEAERRWGSLAGLILKHAAEGEVSWTLLDDSTWTRDSS